MKNQEPLIFTGTSNNPLAKEVSALSGVHLGRISIKEFPDGEINVEISEKIHGRDVYVLQTIALRPNHFLMELLIIIDALKRAGARSITAIIPYFGYCRQDRKTDAVEPITARLVANLLEAAGATNIQTMDLHSPQIQGFFNIPVKELRANPILLSSLKQLDFNNFIVVTPDIGSVKLAHAFAKSSGVEYVIIDKSRVSATEISVHHLYGDVKDRNVLLVDDICSTGATLVAAANTCQAEGAKRIIAIVTHGLFMGDALKKIENSPIEKLLVSNTVPLTEKSLQCPKLMPVSLAQIFSGAITE